MSDHSRYVFGPELGRGGMGVVYEATDSLLRRRVAVKVLRDDHLSAERRRRFLQEAQAASALSHPNIITVYDVVSSDGHDFIVMELVDGTPLSQAMPPHGFPLAQLLDYSTQISGAIAAAHAAGILHRDVKPANIMVSRDGQLKIVDFGLSKVSPSDSHGIAETSTAAPHTLVGVVMGSRGYMSPEQACGDPVDLRTDVFSLGVVLYEMAAGRRPFEGGSLQSFMHAPAASLAGARPDVPPAFAALVAHCVERDPARRPSTAAEVHQALRAIEPPPHPSAWISSRGSRFWASATLAVAAMLLGLGGWVWTSAQRAAAERERAAAAQDAARLANEGRFVDVWRVTGPALERWPGDPQLVDAVRASTDTVTIATDPPGAEVAFKAYDGVDGPWTTLGTTPLNGVRAPLGMLRWRLTKEGFEPLEARLEVGAPSAAVGRPDVSARPVRLVRVGEDDGLVFVPAAVPGGTLTDFSIDRTEVTNRTFQQFVDRGGYEDRRLWQELARQIPARVDARGAPTGLVDRTGRPGPSTWELGAFPAGQADHPVSGVSWFEAVAYCASVERTLPTVFHWRRALGETFFFEVVLAGNFEGSGPEDVRRLKDVGPHGTYGLSGNVKEWTWNEFQSRRYILGGSWNEPPYMATADDMRPPLDRAATNGFRCMRESAPAGAAAYAPWAGDAPREGPGRLAPVSASEFEILRRFYAYDPTPLDSRVERSQEQEHWQRERVSFTAAYGQERVLAHIFIPRNATPPFQVVVWFPGSYALNLKSSDGDLPFSQYFDFVPRSGRVLVYPVYKDTYERRAEPSAATPGGAALRDQVTRFSMDFSRTLDYLETRSDMDMRRVAYYGYSMGAARALPILAVEPRLTTAILLTPGLYAYKQPPEIDAINFVPRATLPVLMLGGRYDFTFPVESSQTPLFNLFGTPPEHKRHVIFEDAGHVPPRLGVIREVLDWMDRYLGPVRRDTGPDAVNPK